MGNKVTKPILLVKKSDSKKGSLWNDLANQRIIKQHGGFDIPENDLHAVKKFDGPVLFPDTSSEETNEVLSQLEEEVQKLKGKTNDEVIPDKSNANDN